MEYSKHNIFTKIKNSENHLLFNLLYCQADILNPATAEGYKTKYYINENELIEKGYLVDPEKEASTYRNKYLDFLDNRDNDEIQLFFVPWYSCNFNCSYCYQDEYAPSKEFITKELIDSFFEYIQSQFANKRKYITLFGGEPFLSGTKSEEILDYFFTSAGNNKIGVAVVTNGYNIVEYIDLLEKCTIREVQVTLDGTCDVHNKRRPLKNNNHGTFDKIVTGIDLLLEKGYPVNLRVVIDKDNIDNLAPLARLAIEKGWTKNTLFKTQLGRNYELHHCQTGQSSLFTRIGLYEEIYHLIEKYPDILAFHKPAFSVSRFLFDNGELPDPLFDACPACKTEWAFDYTGKIYPCTANVGKDGDSVGTFYPQKTLNKQIVELWENRDVASIESCKNCSVQLACGGGCGAVAQNNAGTICSSDCRPIEKLLSLGISHYFERENINV